MTATATMTAKPEAFTCVMCLRFMMPSAVDSRDYFIQRRCQGEAQKLSDSRRIVNSGPARGPGLRTIWTELRAACGPAALFRRDRVADEDVLDEVSGDALILDAEDQRRQRQGPFGFFRGLRGPAEGTLGLGPRHAFVQRGDVPGCRRGLRARAAPEVHQTGERGAQD